MRSFSQLVLILFLAIWNHPNTFAHSLPEDETCYQLSTQKSVWSRTLEVLCVANPSPRNPWEEDSRAPKTKIFLRKKLLGGSVEVAQFNYDLLFRARCLDCNEDVYGIAQPENSVFNSLKIRFDGQKNLRDRSEQGELWIGSNHFFYRSL